jgi:hypothetical protein
VFTSVVHACHMSPLAFVIVINWSARSKAWVFSARLLRLGVRIPPGAWMFVSCESGRGLCVGMNTRPE